MRYAIRRGAVALAAAAALGPVAGSAVAQESVRSVPAQTVLETKNANVTPEFCANVVFARWRAQPGETGTVRVHSTFRGAPRVVTVRAPYDDIYDFGPLVGDFVAPNGFHQYALSFNSGAVCAAEFGAELLRRSMAVRVEVTINSSCATPAQVNRLRARLTASRNGHRAARVRTAEARSELRRATAKLIAARAEEDSSGPATRAILRAERERKLAQQRLRAAIARTTTLRRLVTTRQKLVVEAVRSCRN